jgi:transposase-like protein
MTAPGKYFSLGGSGMISQRFAPEFKDEAVRQIVERGYPVSEVAQRLGGSAARRTAFTSG